MKTPLASLCSLLVGIGSVFTVQAETAYTDDFESATINPYWTVVQVNGTIQSTTNKPHGGQRSVQMTRTTGGQLTLQLIHTFATPQYGTVSVWFYDFNSAGYYASLQIMNTASNRSSGFGIQDWNPSTLYYSTFNGYNSTTGRSLGWHQWMIITTPTNQVFMLDGSAIYSGANNIGFDRIVINASGPGNSGSYYFDDFAFTPLPSSVPIQINALTGNGSLTWTNISSLSNALFSVEWAANLNGDWCKSWSKLSGLMATGLTTTVDVPMFFRVKAQPNPLLPLPVDYQMAFFVSNAVGNVSTQLITVLNYTRPRASTNDFALLEQDNFNAGLMLMRSTDTAVYSYFPATGSESLEFQLATVGTSWTNLNYAGSGYDCKVTVEAIENVTVPAGTFLCYKFHKQSVGVPDSDRYEWICPGLGFVKWVDYWVEYSANPPVVYQLQSIGPRSP